MDAWDNDGDFRAMVAAEPEITSLVSPEQLAETFSVDRHLKHVDAIFRRVFRD
jgi:adenylosuccinate lyase